MRSQSLSTEAVQDWRSDVTKRLDALAHAARKYRDAQLAYDPNVRSTQCVLNNRRDALLLAAETYAFSVEGR